MPVIPNILCSSIAPETGQIIDAETGNVIGHADCGAVSEDDAMEKYFRNRCDYLEDGTYNFCQLME